MKRVSSIIYVFSLNTDIKASVPKCWNTPFSKPFQWAVRFWTLASLRKIRNCACGMSHSILCIREHRNSTFFHLRADICGKAWNEQGVSASYGYHYTLESVKNCFSVREILVCQQRARPLYEMWPVFRIDEIWNNRLQLLNKPLRTIKMAICTKK